jgi:hypothetical protein
MVTYRTVGMLLAAAALAFAQDHNTEGTRQLYYLATPPVDNLPPLTQGTTAPSSSPTSPAVHLGLRYNVVLLHGKDKAEQIPSDRVLKEGDCFAIDMQANRSGYLYVLARQSSGSWTPLLPSPEMPGQRNELLPGKKVRIPSGYCFTVRNPPGKETLFVVLSRDQRDFYELYESVKTKENSPMAGANKVDAAVQHLNERFGDSRDISVTRMAEPTRADEPRGAVYVVNTSVKPSASLVTKIEITHR